MNKDNGVLVEVLADLNRGRRALGMEPLLMIPLSVPRHAAYCVAGTALDCCVSTQIGARWVPDELRGRQFVRVGLTGEPDKVRWKTAAHDLAAAWEVEGPFFDRDGEAYVPLPPRLNRFVDDFDNGKYPEFKRELAPEEHNGPATTFGEVLALVNVGRVAIGKKPLRWLLRGDPSTGTEDEDLIIAGRRCALGRALGRCITTFDDGAPGRTYTVMLRDEVPARALAQAWGSPAPSCCRSKQQRLGMWEVDLPGLLNEFVYAFDEGFYPELIRAAA